MYDITECLRFLQQLTVRRWLQVRTSLERVIIKGSGKTYLLALVEERIETASYSVFPFVVKVWEKLEYIELESEPFNSEVQMYPHWLLMVHWSFQIKFKNYT